jgi:hypothetical protein
MRAEMTTNDLQPDGRRHVLSAGDERCSEVEWNLKFLPLLTVWTETTTHFADEPSFENRPVRGNDYRVAIL